MKLGEFLSSHLSPLGATNPRLFLRISWPSNDTRDVTDGTEGVAHNGTNSGTHARNSLFRLGQLGTVCSGSLARINELARVITRSVKLGTHFQSAALPTELPGRRTRNFMSDNHFCKRERQRSSLLPRREIGRKDLCITSRVPDSLAVHPGVGRVNQRAPLVAAQRLPQAASHDVGVYGHLRRVERRGRPLQQRGHVGYLATRGRESRA